MFKRARYKPAPIDRFMAKVEPEPNSGCWLWTGCTNRAGYGQVRVRYRSYLAHRWSFMHHDGSELGPGVAVLHRCDNPPCVNPDHLFPGTQADNMADMARKGRRARDTGIRGTRHGRSVLTDELVREVRRLSGDGLRPAQISRALSVSLNAVTGVVNGKTWRHV